MRAIIIDDEPLARAVIREYLSSWKEIEIVAECANGFEGIKAISHYHPDLLFLDVQMSKISGFEMLEVIDEMPGIIFTTAFEEFAVKAFESNAVDYLLKPFNKERFDKAMSKWLESRTRENDFPHEKKLLDSLSLQPVQSNRMVVKSGHEIRIIPSNEILYVEAYDDYIKIHVKDDCFLKMQTMQKTELQLGDQKFLRVHRSYIINLNEITRIEPLSKESYVAIMRDKTRIPLSKSGYLKLKAHLGI